MDTAWRESGTGPPLVLLHGVPTSSLLFRDARALLPGRVLAPDLPGYGESGALRAPTPEAYLDWLEAWLDEVGVERAAFAGQDFGAYLAAGLTRRGRVRALGLTSTALGWGWLPSMAAALPPFDQLFYRLFAGRAYLGRAERAGPLEALHVGRIASDPDFVERMRQTALALRPLQVEPVPAVAIWGSEDPLFPPWMGRRTAAAIGAEWHCIEGGRHTLPWDRPARWAGILADFLERTPP